MSVGATTRRPSFTRRTVAQAGSPCATTHPTSSPEESLMNLPELSRDLITGTALIALLAVTRIGHFGGIATPPDASLAVFFLLGLWVASARWLVIGLLAAAAADALAVAQGASTYCITPAYPFLIPTYGVLWGAGRATCRSEEHTSELQSPCNLVC